MQTPFILLVQPSFARRTRPFVLSCGKVWDSACDIQEIRNSTNTKVSYEAAFQFFHRQLAKLGVESVDEFKSIIRAHQARELRRRRREKSAAQTRPKNGIMSAVNRTTKSMVIGAAVILSGMAAPLRSDASARISITPPTQSRVAHNFTDRITSTVSQGSSMYCVKGESEKALHGSESGY